MDDERRARRADAIGLLQLKLLQMGRHQPIPLLNELMTVMTNAVMKAPAEYYVAAKVSLNRIIQEIRNDDRADPLHSMLSQLAENLTDFFDKMHAEDDAASAAAAAQENPLDAEQNVRGNQLLNNLEDDDEGVEEREDRALDGGAPVVDPLLAEQPPAEGGEEDDLADVIEIDDEEPFHIPHPIDPIDGNQLAPRNAPINDEEDEDIEPVEQNYPIDNIGNQVVANGNHVILAGDRLGEEEEEEPDQEESDEEEPEREDGPNGRVERADPALAADGPAIDRLLVYFPDDMRDVMREEIQARFNERGRLARLDARRLARQPFRAVHDPINPIGNQPVQDPIDEEEEEEEDIELVEQNDPIDDVGNQVVVANGNDPLLAEDGLEGEGEQDDEEEEEEAEEESEEEPEEPELEDEEEEEEDPIENIPVQADANGLEQVPMPNAGELAMAAGANGAAQPEFRIEDYLIERNNQDEGEREVQPIREGRKRRAEEPEPQIPIQDRLTRSFIAQGATVHFSNEDEPKLNVLIDRLDNHVIRCYCGAEFQQVDSAMRHYRRNHDHVEKPTFAISLSPLLRPVN